MIRLLFSVARRCAITIAQCGAAALGLLALWSWLSGVPFTAATEIPFVAGQLAASITALLHAGGSGQVFHELAPLATQGLYFKADDAPIGVLAICLIEFFFLGRIAEAIAMIAATIGLAALALVLPTAGIRWLLKQRRYKKQRKAVAGQQQHGVAGDATEAEAVAVMIRTYRRAPSADEQEF